MTDENTTENTEEPKEEVEEIKYCSFDDFMKVSLKIAEIVEAGDHPNADKLLLLKLKVGDKNKQICAGIKAFYDPENLVGKRIVIVDNLEPRKLRGELSEGMLLAARDEKDGVERVVLVTTDLPDVASGSDVG